MLATVCGSSRVRFIYGSRTVANHAQGRENWFNKEQPNLLEGRFAGFFSQVKFQNLFFVFAGKRLLCAGGQNKI